MKKAIFVLSLVLPFSAVAGTLVMDGPSPKIEGKEICKDKALENLVSFDTAAVADKARLRLVGLDDRWLNPSHYAWYELEIVTADGLTKTVRTRVQLDRFSGDCI